MKEIVLAYTFDASARKVTFTDQVPQIEDIDLITNVTDNIVIFQFNSPAKGGTLSGSVLTLTYDTSAMSDSDKLKINITSQTNRVEQGDLNAEYDNVAVRQFSTTFDNLSAAATNALLFPQTDVSQYQTITAHIFTIGSGNFVQFAFSEDGTTWQAETTVGAGGQYVFSVKGRFFRAMLTVYGGVAPAVGSVTLLGGSASNVSIGKVPYPVPAFATAIGMSDNANNLSLLNSLAKVGDGGSGNLALGVGLVGFNGTNLTRMRSADITRYANANASGDTVVWTPTSGKRFRLLGFMIKLSENASQAVAGNMTIQLRDATSATIAQFRPFVPQTAGTTMGDGWSTGFIELGNTGGGLGFQSGNANRALNVNLSAALATGYCDVVAVGTED